MNLGKGCTAFGSAECGFGIEILRDEAGILYWIWTAHGS